VYHHENKSNELFLKIPDADVSVGTPTPAFGGTSEPAVYFSPAGIQSLPRILFPPKVGEKFGINLPSSQFLFAFLVKVF